MQKDEMAIDVCGITVEAFQRVHTELKSCVGSETAGSVWCGLSV
jgi:hypothetical protein